jgi:hypothetical protein
MSTAMKEPTVAHCLSLFYRLHSLPVAEATQTFTADDLAALKWLVNGHLERARDREQRVRLAELVAMSPLRACAKCGRATTYELCTECVDPETAGHE